MGHKLTLEMRIDDDVYTPRIPDSLTIKELNSKLLKHLKQKTGKDVNLAGLQVKKSVLQKSYIARSHGRLRSTNKTNTNKPIP